MNVVLKCERCGKIITKSGDKDPEGKKIDDYYDLMDNCNVINHHGRRIAKETETGEIAYAYSNGNIAYLCDKCYQEFNNFMKPKKEK